MNNPHKALSLAIEAAKADPNGGKVMLSLDDAEAVAEVVRDLSGALCIVGDDPQFAADRLLRNPKRAKDVEPNMPTKLMRISEFFYRMLRPRFWQQNRPTCYQYSSNLEKQLRNNPEISCAGRYSARVNGVQIWVANYPYNYGGLYTSPDGSYSLPTARVRELLRDTLSDFYAQHNPWEEGEGK